jgi:hypothetical protein
MVLGLVDGFVLVYGIGLVNGFGIVYCIGLVDCFIALWMVLGQVDGFGIGDRSIV